MATATTAVEAALAHDGGRLSKAQRDAATREITALLRRPAGDDDVCRVVHALSRAKANALSECVVEAAVALAADVSAQTLAGVYVLLDAVLREIVAGSAEQGTLLGALFVQLATKIDTLALTPVICHVCDVLGSLPKKGGAKRKLIDASAALAARSCADGAAHARALVTLHCALSASVDSTVRAPYVASLGTIAAAVGDDETLSLLLTELSREASSLHSASKTVRVACLDALSAALPRLEPQQRSLPEQMSGALIQMLLPAPSAVTDEETRGRVVGVLGRANLHSHAVAQLLGGAVTSRDCRRALVAHVDRTRRVSALAGAVRASRSRSVTHGAGVVLRECPSALLQHRVEQLVHQLERESLCSAPEQPQPAEPRSAAALAAGLAELELLVRCEAADVAPPTLSRAGQLALGACASPDAEARRLGLALARHVAASCHERGSAAAIARELHLHASARFLLRMDAWETQHTAEALAWACMRCSVPAPLDAIPAATNAPEATFAMEAAVCVAHQLAGFIGRQATSAKALADGDGRAASRCHANLLTAVGQVSASVCAALALISSAPSAVDGAMEAGADAAAGTGARAHAQGVGACAADAADVGGGLEDEDYMSEEIARLEREKGARETLRAHLERACAPASRLLASSLEDERSHPRCRVAATRALGALLQSWAEAAPEDRYYDPTAERALAAVLQRPSEHACVRFAAIEAVHGLLDVGAELGALGHAESERLLYRALLPAGPDVGGACRVRALELLEALFSVRRCRPVVSLLLPALADPEPSVVERGTRVLETISAHDGVGRALCRALLAACLEPSSSVGNHLAGVLERALPTLESASDGVHVAALAADAAKALVAQPAPDALVSARLGALLAALPASARTVRTLSAKLACVRARTRASPALCAHLVEHLERSALGAAARRRPASTLAAEAAALVAQLAPGAEEDDRGGADDSDPAPSTRALPEAAAGASASEPADAVEDGRGCAVAGVVSAAALRAFEQQAAVISVLVKQQQQAA